MALLDFRLGNVPLFAGIVAIAIVVGPVHANPLNSWQEEVACEAERGAISKDGDVRTFRPSPNKCPGGVFSQRAEIFTDHIPPTAKGAYLFETQVAMTSNETKQFTIFQVHDARLGCAPPLSVAVRPTGNLVLHSDIKTGEGENCTPSSLDSKMSREKLRRDGTEQELSVLIDFDGAGGFDVQVSLDGILAVSGTYDPSKQPAEYLSKKFYFKHGVYSQDMFDYKMTSRAMQVHEVSAN